MLSRVTSLFHKNQSMIGQFKPALTISRHHIIDQTSFTTTILFKIIIQLKQIITKMINPT